MDQNKVIYLIAEKNTERIERDHLETANYRALHL